MQDNPEELELTEKILKAIEKQYGFIPLVNQVLSERPDIFVPSATMGKAILEGKGELDQKTRYLAAISAATAMGSPHCIKVQMQHAIQVGATRDEILESMLIGSYMAMTRSQSFALREYAEMFQTDD